ncbi:hypothetical protein D9615_008022 [Tricholomella constricta]|uniref:XPG-I domain-containing protein n=1 Tax=Tricholomella constricta TaxID=117010 RepID=A0A8H5H296_9AGAR|nr:hypothetical protein D9615_008022 [Tricholomella constricta]
MGVAGLWDIIRPAGKTRSLTDISVTEGFEANLDGVRGFRVGIDASIWFFHAEYGREGENPVLRTLFFRCATLMHSPFLPLFVFDGPRRPDWKRGKKINKTSHKLIPGMKAIVESFGFEWRMAPGEAEAELAYLNRIGVIDGILSDDVDNFLFGATTVIRNPSNNLSGNRANPVVNAAGKDDKNHTKVYRISDITAHPDIRLTRGGLVLIGLMSGGDYQQGGLNGCGTVTSHGLAKCGFGDMLFQAANSMTREELKTFLIAWRHELCHELRTNSQGHIGRKQPSLAKSVPADFPDIDILLSYTNPITSESMGRTENNLKLTWAKEPDLGKLAATCEFYFEWGYREAIIKRFRTVIWPSAVLRILRRAVLDLDAKARSGLSPPTTPRKAGKPAREAIGTPSKMIAKHFSTMALGNRSDSDDDDDDAEPLIVKIHAERKHVSTDGVLEYRLEIAPAQLVRIAESGIKGTRFPEGSDEWADEEEDEGGKGAKKPPPDPNSRMRVWMPACMVRLVEPSLVEEYEAMQEKKREKKAGKGRVKAKSKSAPVADDGSASSGEDDLPVIKPARKAAPKPRVKTSSKATVVEEIEEEIQEANTQASRVVRDLTKKNAKAYAKANAKSTGTDLKSFFPTTKPSNNIKAKIPASLTHTTSAPKSQSAVHDLTKKKPPRNDPNPTRLKKGESHAVVSSSKTKQVDRNANNDDEDSDTSLRLRDMLVSPTKPNRLASWDRAPTNIYVSVSDSDDDDASKANQAFLDDSHMFDSDDLFNDTPRPSHTSSTGSRPKQSQKQKPSSFSSGSDSPRHHPHKSPRRASGHTSPRKCPPSFSNSRPTSPSPAKPARAMAHPPSRAPLRVIEISDSDSDEDLPPVPRFEVPPLMRARARAEVKAVPAPTKQTTLKNFTKPEVKKKFTAKSMNVVQDIIDLT